jgi:hypothetical protein
MRHSEAMLMMMILRKRQVDELLATKQTLQNDKINQTTRLNKLQR